MPGPLGAVFDIITMFPHGLSQEEDLGEEVLRPLLAGGPQLVLEEAYFNLSSSQTTLHIWPQF